MDFPDWEKAGSGKGERNRGTWDDQHDRPIKYLLQDTHHDDLWAVARWKHDLVVFLLFGLCFGFLSFLGHEGEDDDDYNGEACSRALDIRL